MFILFKKLSNWFLLSIASTFIFAFIFVSVYQTNRTDANNSLVDVAQNLTGYFEDSSTAATQFDQFSTQVDGSPKVDLANSDKTFIELYNKDYKITTSTAVLDGKSPELPSGSLEAAKKNGVNKITWAPKNNLRQAVVIYPVQSGDVGYIVVGKSLKGVEENIAKTGKILLLGWAITLLITLLSSIVISNLIETIESGKFKKQVKLSKTHKHESLPEPISTLDKEIKIVEEDKPKHLKADKEEVKPEKSEKITDLKAKVTKPTPKK